jgi:hypothetical protein
VETKAHLCFLKKVGGRCGCVYGTKGAVDQKSLGTTDVDVTDLALSQDLPSETRKTQEKLSPPEYTTSGSRHRKLNILDTQQQRSSLDYELSIFYACFYLT